MSQPKYDYRHLNRELDIVKSKIFMNGITAFFAPLMCSMDFIWSEEIDTAATDGKTIWWHPQFFLEAPHKFGATNFNEGVLRHELWHSAKLHGLRQGSRDSEWWNYACDIRINNDLLKEGFTFGSFPVWRRASLDKNGPMAEEDIYAFLQLEGHPIPENPWGNGELIINHDSGQTDQEVINNVVKSVTNAKFEGKEGHIPQDLEVLLNNFLAPVVRWEKYLYKWMHDLLNTRISWARPNRRYQQIYLPSKKIDEGKLDHLIYFQDTSGSITPAGFKRFNSELKYVWDTFKPKKMTVVQFDTIIQKVDVYEEGDEFAEVVIRGRGGTCLICVRDFIIENKPTAAIIFSDLQVTPMQKLPFDIPVLWVSTEKYNEVAFGQVINIKV